MLVLVSFGLVLLATILLIVGLFNDTLGLIYLSIAASVIAAIVLFLAFRMARPKAEKDREAPEPIDPEGIDDTSVVADADSDADSELDDDADIAIEVPAVAAAATTDDDWMDDEQWDDEVADFPIADYDDLTVAEIMPLLPQLYSDELDLVIDRERAGRKRSRIIGRLEELKVSGTEADEVAVPAPAAAAPGAVADHGDDDFFPIADYDSLTVGQITPLLDQLELDELSDVRSREASGANRKMILAEIDQRLAGDDPAPVPAVAAVRKATKKASTAKKAATTKKAAKASTPARKATKKASPARKSAKKATKKAAKKAASPRFPIADYDNLTVADIRPRLSDLSPAQLEAVRIRETSGAGRKTILNEIDGRLS